MADDAADDELPPFKFRLAKVADVPAVRDLFDATFPIKYDDKFYDLLEAGIDRGSMLGVAGKLVCAVAETSDGELAGAIVLHTMNVSDAKKSGQLAFDLVEDQGPGALAAYILLLAVDERFRRRGAASDLIFHGTMLLADTLDTAEGNSLVALFCHTKADDAVSNALYRAISFSLLGRVPKHYTIDGKPHDAHVWVLPMKGSHPVTYKGSGVKGEPADLTDPAHAVPLRVWRLSPAVRSLLLQFGLPIGGVILLYLVAYALVVLGPLRGISGHKPGQVTNDDPYAELGADELEEL